MNLTKILVGMTLGTTLLFQGCVSNLGTRMFEICSPFSNVPKSDLDKKVHILSNITMQNFNEYAKQVLNDVDYRCATIDELDGAIGRYVFLNGGIIFIADSCVESYDSSIIFHEMIHRLDYTGKIDRFKFFTIYDDMDSEMFPFKKQIEKILKSQEYNSSFWKDPHSERIAYTFDFWNSKKVNLPEQMVEFGKSFLDTDFVAKLRKRQQSLYIANR